MTTKAHPISVLYFTLRYIFVFMLPVLGLVFSPQSAVKIAWWNVLLFTITLTAAYFQYKKTFIKFDENSLTVMGGLTASKSKTINFCKVTSADFDSTPILALSKAVSVRIETYARRGKRAALSLRLYREDALKIMQLLRGKSSVRNQYNVSHRHLALMALSSSNAATGLLFASPLFSAGGYLLGQEFKGRILSTVKNASYFAAKYLPPLGAFLGTLLLLGWIISFFRIFSHHYSLVAARSDNCIKVKSGLVSERQTIISAKDINSLELRQTLFMKLWKMHSVYIRCAGYGRQKGERAILIPAESKKSCIDILGKIIPELSTGKLTIKPPKKALFAYLFTPLLYAAASTAAAAAAFKIYPQYLSLIMLFFAAGLVLSMWRLLVSVRAYSSSGLGINDNTISCGYSRGFALYNVHIPVEKIQMVKITQNIFQQKSNLCNITVLVKSDKKTAHLVKGVPIDAAIMVKDSIVS